MRVEASWVARAQVLWTEPQSALVTAEHVTKVLTGHSSMGPSRGSVRQRLSLHPFLEEITEAQGGEMTCPGLGTSK